MEEFTFRILLLGETTVGKTSLLFRYLEDKFSFHNLLTAGIDSRIKSIKRNNKMVYLRIYDTAGQEKYRAIVKNLYKGADGILLVYDVTNIKSFNSITYWIKSLKDNIEINEIGLVIVGNKIDLPDKVINDEQKTELENTLNTKIIEVSAKDNINVNEAFDKIVDIMMEIKLKKTNIRKNNTIKLGKTKIKNNPTESNCCLSSKK